MHKTRKKAEFDIESRKFLSLDVKGEVSPNNNVDWVSRKQFYKPNSNAKLCMLPSLDGTLPEYVISQEDNSPLTLYIDFHSF